MKGPRVVLSVAVPAVVSAAALAGATHATTAHAITPPASPIKHVVVIYQENHSFDNLLGDLCVTDRATESPCDGAIPPGHVLSDIVPEINHDVASQTLALSGLWTTIGGCGPKAGFPCLGYYTPAQIPKLAALATDFAISDRTFQSNDAPSWGAHLELAAGTLDGFTGDNPARIPGAPAQNSWGCDSGRSAAWVPPVGSSTTTTLVPSCIPDHSLPLGNGGASQSTPVAHVPTIMDEMDAAHITWKLYAAPANTPGYQWAICPTFAGCLYGAQRTNMVANTQVVADAATGTLPQWSVVLPTSADSQHNKQSMATGDTWVGQVVSAIENGPDWSSTAIFIAYDDCGCFWDHVAPPAGDGIRSPMVIVSPYAKAGFTDSQPTTVTGGVLAYTEHLFGLAPLTSLDTDAYDYSGAFDYTQHPLSPRPLPASAPASRPTATAADEEDGT
jgi:phospholipase C